MLALYATVLLAATSSISAAPLHKRIQQNIADSLAQWENACHDAANAAGNQALFTQCNPVKVNAFSTLLAAAGPCAQQDAADNLIDLGHQIGGDITKMTRLAQIFHQQPRNAPDSLSVLYCQSPPRNQELAGLFQCQFQGVNDNVFTGNVPLGSAGTIPFGQSSPLSPPGSCPAHPDGKVPDGQQLVDLVSDPGVPSSGGNGDTRAPPASTPAADPLTDVNEPETTPASPPATTAPSQGSNTPSSGTGFQLSNAQKAQQQNVGFESLAEGSSCTVGDVACIDGKFAQCPFGTFVTTPCAGGTQCLALPLVNSVGTSVTCTTLDDAARRFAAAGATGGFDGNH